MHFRTNVRDSSPVRVLRRYRVTVVIIEVFCYQHVFVSSGALFACGKLSDSRFEFVIILGIACFAASVVLAADERLWSSYLGRQ